MPQRIQLRRTKGWRKPADAIVVSRPSMWGNPFPVDVYGGRAVDLYETLMQGRMSIAEMESLSKHIDGSLVMYRATILKGLYRLRGHDLCCWCSPLIRCHADHLLKIANEER